MSSATRWIPDETTRAAGQSARVPYRYADETGPGEQRSPYPALVALHDAIVQPWPGVTSGGMRRDSARIGTTNRDPHKAGISIDYMIRNDANRVANGTALATFLVRNAELLQLQYIIWNGTELSTSNIGQRWEAYTGEEGHGDHLHVEIGPVAREWSYDEMMRRVRSALAAWSAAPEATGHTAAYVVGGVALAAALAVVFGSRR